MVRSESEFVGLSNSCTIITRAQTKANTSKHCHNRAKNHLITTSNQQEKSKTTKSTTPAATDVAAGMRCLRDHLEGQIS